MNTSSLSYRGLLCLLVALMVFAVALGPAAASEPEGIIADAPPLFAGLLQDVVGNRTRLIQVSCLFILVGIFILWKK